MKILGALLLALLGGAVHDEGNYSGMQAGLRLIFFYACVAIVLLLWPLGYILIRGKADWGKWLAILVGVDLVRWIALSRWSSSHPNCSSRPCPGFWPMRLASWWAFTMPRSSTKRHCCQVT